jgi:3-deoxy-D-manno-octulosonate 8-phosphate phosphatase (KDO 8-P phosphatase)
MDLTEKARRIRLLLMDCDGVLTDGRLYFSANGEELKVFDVHDGQGLVSWHKAGFHSGIISGRGAAAIIKARADELGIRYLKTSSADKISDFRMIIADAGVLPDEVAYIGDDIGDIGLMGLVGLSVAVADAVAEAKQAAFLITESPGGRGAVREVTDLLLNAKT